VRVTGGLAVRVRTGRWAAPPTAASTAACPATVVGGREGDRAVAVQDAQEMKGPENSTERGLDRAREEAACQPTLTTASGARTPPAPCGLRMVEA
jgi:hypothetical protein